MAVFKVFFVVAVFYGQTQGESCSSDSNCYDSKVCCNRQWSIYGECADSCLGKSCSVDSNCGLDSGLHCCDDICRQSCEGSTCTVTSQCGGDLYCCSQTCRKSCSGSFCVFNSDCSGDYRYCCENSCQKGTCGMAGWAVALIVVCVLGVVGTIAGIVLCVYCARRHRSPGLVLTAAPLLTMPATSTAVGADLNVSSYPQGPPPVYQPPQPVFQPSQPVFQPPQQVFQQQQPRN